MQTLEKVNRQQIAMTTMDAQKEYSENVLNLALPFRYKHCTRISEPGSLQDKMSLRMHPPAREQTR